MLDSLRSHVQLLGSIAQNHWKKDLLLEILEEESRGYHSSLQRVQYPAPKLWICWINSWCTITNNDGRREKHWVIPFSTTFVTKFGERCKSEYSGRASGDHCWWNKDDDSVSTKCNVNILLLIAVELQMGCCLMCLKRLSKYSFRIFDLLIGSSML